MIGRYIELRI